MMTSHPSPTSHGPTNLKVAVHGQNGATQRLIDALEDAAIHAEIPDDLTVWANGTGQRAVVLSIESTEELDTVIDLRDSNWDLVVVTLTPDDAQATYRQALRAGATATAPASAPVEEIVEVVREALHGRSVLPAGVARRFALESPEMPREYAPNLDEISWIQAMAAGQTMSEIADAADISKSELNRRLNAMYEQIGAENRTEAIIKFARWGLLD